MVVFFKKVVLLTDYGCKVTTKQAKKKKENPLFFILMKNDASLNDK
jgi:hypothetical protein